MRRERVGWDFLGVYPPLPFSATVCVCRRACEAQLGGVCTLSERGTVIVHCLWTLVLGVTAVASQLLMFPDQDGLLPLFLPSRLSPEMEDPSIHGIPGVWDQNLFIRPSVRLFLGETDRVCKWDVMLGQSLYFSRWCCNDCVWLHWHTAILWSPFSLF